MNSLASHNERLTRIIACVQFVNGKCVVMCDRAVGEKRIVLLKPKLVELTQRTMFSFFSWKLVQHKCTAIVACFRVGHKTKWPRV
jgi:hypothetical protein